MAACNGLDVKEGRVEDEVARKTARAAFGRRVKDIGMAEADSKKQRPNKVTTLSQMCCGSDRKEDFRR